MSIAIRKAGARVICPLCGFRQTAPGHSAEAATPPQGSAEAAGAGPRPPQPVRQQAEAARAKVPPHSTPPPDEPIPPPMAGPVPAAAAARPAPAMPSGTILYRRPTLYVHGLLFLLLAAGAFAAGYFVGRGDAAARRPHLGRQATAAAAGHSVVVDGALHYEAEPGPRAPDAGAVVVALPAERMPETKLSIDGLPPRADSGWPPSESLRRIEDFGGAWARADASGSFRIVVPEPGAYHVLLISRQARRAPGSDVDPLDLSQIGRYFERPADLIGAHEYRWSLEPIRGDGRSIEHTFGRGGRE